VIARQKFGFFSQRPDDVLRRGPVFGSADGFS
jgi:hypothetical protein